MKNLKFIGFLVIWGAITTFMSCSNDGENLGMYSDEEFHDKIVQIQNKYNSSLKIDEASLHKDDETLTNINDIMRTIENSSFDYELIVSEDGGLIAMPILNTVSARDYTSESNPVSYTLSHDILPCAIIVSGVGTNFQIKPFYNSFQLINVSCTGSIGENYIILNGDIKLRVLGEEDYTTYNLYCKKNYREDIFEVVKKD